MKYQLVISFLIAFCSCKEKALPVLGHRINVDGKEQIQKTPDFSLLDQNAHIINKDSLQNQIHIADFFFTSCPTICPKTIRSMMELEKEFGDDPRVSFLCFSIDYKRDSLQRIQHYASKLGIENPRFHFLVPKDKQENKRIADGYMSTALDDESAPGGFDHSAYLLLVDRNFQLRSYAVGTDPEDVKRLAKDIHKLLKE